MFNLPFSPVQTHPYSGVRLGLMGSSRVLWRSQTTLLFRFESTAHSIGQFSARQTFFELAYPALNSLVGSQNSDKTPFLSSLPPYTFTLCNTFGGKKINIDNLSYSITIG